MSLAGLHILCHFGEQFGKETFAQCLAESGSTFHCHLAHRLMLEVLPLVLKLRAFGCHMYESNIT